MATLARITIHPVKSLDGLAVPEARVLPSGALAHDRRWQLTDEQGQVVNGKRTALLHAIRADFEFAADTDAAGWVALLPDPAALRVAALPGLERLRRLAPATFPLVPGPEGPCEWLGEALGMTVRLVERVAGGFPDDRDAPGPTVAAAATLVEVARWFDLELDECRRRFRVNLEIAGWEAFAEDALASPAWSAAPPTLAELAPDLVSDPYADLPPPEPRRFTVGAVPLVAAHVCRRCVVPARDSRTGAADPVFRDAFEARRRRGLRRDVDVASWSHLYRLAINTRPAGAGGAIAVGDAVVG